MSHRQLVVQVEVEPLVEASFLTVNTHTLMSKKVR